MSDKDLEEALRRWLGREAVPERLEETVGLCGRMARAQAAAPGMPFWSFLADIFRLEGPSILLAQGAALLLAGLILWGAPGDLRVIPVYTPLLVLAAVPALFRGQHFGTGELEAVTYASGAQLALAKLILSGAAELVGMTLLLWLEVRLTGGSRGLGCMILYCLVPYLVCMTVLLQLLRRGGSGGLPLGIVTALGSCLFWRGSSYAVPGLYELSAVGVWIGAFAVSTAFFTREVWLMVKADKEGRMYGAVV